MSKMILPCGEFDPSSSDDEIEGEVKGGYDVAKDGTLGWSGLRVVNDDPIDADWTDMSFTITNGLANA